MEENYKETFKHYENVRDRLFIKVQRDTANSAIVNWPCKRIDKTDLIMTYHVMFSVVRTPSMSELNAAPVTNELLALWGISEDQLHEDAIASAVRLFPEKHDSIEKMITVFPMGDARTGLVVLTTDVGVNGAAAIAYPGVLEKIAEEEDEDVLFIFPSSVHEVIVLPLSLSEGNVNAYKEMVTDINTTLSPKDVLSNNVYIYTKKDDTIRIV